MAHVVSEPHSPLLLPVPENPTQTCISRDEFRRLPFELQWDYAIHYELPDAAHLTSDNICHILCTRNEWIPAIPGQGHIQYPSSNGMIVGKDIMEMVDILVEQGAKDLHSSYGQGLPECSLDALVNPSIPLSQHVDDDDTSNDAIIAAEWLTTIIDELERTNERVRLQISEVRCCAREAAADVVEFKAKMLTEIAYRDSAMHKISDIMGTPIARELGERDIRSNIEDISRAQRLAEDEDGFSRATVEASQSSPREASSASSVYVAPPTLSLAQLPDSNPILQLPYPLTSIVPNSVSIHNPPIQAPTPVQFNNPVFKFGNRSSDVREQRLEEISGCSLVPPLPLAPSLNTNHITQLPYPLMLTTAPALNSITNNILAAPTLFQFNNLTDQFGSRASNVRTRSSPEEGFLVPPLPLAPLLDANPISQLPYPLMPAVEVTNSFSNVMHSIPARGQSSTSGHWFFGPNRKRACEDVDDFPNDAPRQHAESSHPSSESDTPPHRAKRARPDDTTETQTGNEVRWCDYPSDGETDGDTSSYSPSVGMDEEYVEDNDIDVEASLRLMDKRLKRKNRMVVLQSSDSSYGIEDYTSEEGIRWSTYPSDEDATDSSYCPGSWDLEHILEITTEGRYSHDYYEDLDAYTYMDELLEFGPLSDNSLTTDDDTNFKDLSHFRPSGVRVSKSLFHHSSAPEDHLKQYTLDLSTWEMVEVENPERREIEERADKYFRWTGLLQDLKDPEWVKCNVNGRIDEIALDRHIFEFDDEEWKFFEETVFPYE